jgi:hypothetical protein
MYAMERWYKDHPRGREGQKWEEENEEHMTWLMNEAIQQAAKFGIEGVYLSNLRGREEGRGIVKFRLVPPAHPAKSFPPSPTPLFPICLSFLLPPSPSLPPPPSLPAHSRSHQPDHSRHRQHQLRCFRHASPSSFLLPPSSFLMPPSSLLPSLLPTPSSLLPPSSPPAPSFLPP